MGHIYTNCTNKNEDKSENSQATTEQSTAAKYKRYTQLQIKLMK